MLTERDGQRIHTVYQPGSFVPLLRIEGDIPEPVQTLADTLTQDSSITFTPEVTQQLHQLEQELRDGELSSHSEQWLAVSQLTPERLLPLLKPLPEPTTPVVHLYHCDHLGTPIALINAQGGTDWRAEFDPWGNQVDGSNPQRLYQPIRMQGQHYDDESGMHYNRHRYYDPALGRYISQDPIGLRGGWNNYVYTTNPLSQVDPFGLETKVIVNNNGLGHVGVYTGSGNDAIIYDPGGSFTTPQGIPAGSGDVFYGEEADLGRYLEYQYIDGDDVTVYTFNTTKEEEDKLKIIIDEQGGCAPLLCSTCSGSALRQLERFKSLGSTRTPWGMKSEMETILNN